MTFKEKKRTVPGVRTRQGKWWVAGWRQDKRSRSIQLGPVNSMTREEALAEARRRKTEVFGELAEPRTQHVGHTVAQATADSKAISDLAAEVKELRGLIEGLNTSIGLMLGVDPQLATENADAFSVDVAAIKAARSIIVARDAEKLRIKEAADDAEEVAAKREHRKPVNTLCIHLELFKEHMICDTCDCDFEAYPSEARFCPTCGRGNIHLIEVSDRWLHDLARDLIKQQKQGARMSVEPTAKEDERKSQTIHLPPPDLKLLDGEYIITRDESEGAEGDRMAWSVVTPRGCINYLGEGDFGFVAVCGSGGEDGFESVEETRDVLNEFCDECDGDSRDCWKTEMTPEEAKQDDDARIPGITWNKARRTWELKTKIKGKRKYIKSFADKKDAIKAKAEADAKEAARLAANARAKPKAVSESLDDLTAAKRTVGKRVDAADAASGG